MMKSREKTRVPTASRVAKSPPPAHTGRSEASTDIAAEHVGHVRKYYRKPSGILHRDGTPPPPNAAER